MRSAVAALAALVVLAGCGGSSGSGGSGGDDDRADAPDACGRLTDAQVEELAGQPVTQRRADEVGALPACLYQVESGDRVQVIDVPAAQWSEELPALLDQVEQSGVLDDQATRDKFAAARKKLDTQGSLDDDEACGLFSELLEIQGLPAGEDSIVNFVPTREDPAGVNGQTCTDGVYTSVQLQSDDLADADAVAARVQTALAAAHDRD